MPAADASEQEHYGYLMRLGMTVSALVLVTVSMIALALGALPGISGFARTDAIQSAVASQAKAVEQLQSIIVRDRQDEIGEMRANRSQQLAGELISYRRSECNAKREESRILYFNLIEKDINTYNYLNPDHPYQLPACSDL